MAKGWIKVHRTICENELWLSEPFTKAQAWVDLLLLADHENDETGRYRKGTVYRGKEFLSKRWKWSRNKVTRFYDYLEKKGMITQYKTQGGTHNGTLVTIVNYDKYQKRNTQYDTQCDAQNDTPTINKEEDNSALPKAADILYGGFS